jgi:hypothetical protein
MIAMGRDGVATEVGPRGKKLQRGRNLSHKQARRLGDMIALFLREGVGLSWPDVCLILSRSVEPKHIWERVESLPDPVKKHCRGSWRELREGMEHELREMTRNAG